MKKTVKSFILSMTIISILLLTFLLTSCAGFGGCIHEWDEGEVLIVPTDETSGLIAYVCQKCEETKVEKIDHIHKWSEGSLETNPETGKTFKMYACLICDEVKIVDITDECDHTWDEGTVTTEPTCGQKGTKTFKCSICQDTKEEPIDPTGEHTPVDVEALAPSCGVSGNTAGKKCSVCETVLEGIEEVAPTGEHIWDEGVVTTEPTCKDGVKTFTCTVCLSTKEETLPAISEHIPDDEVVVAPTCEENGSRIVSCAVCQLPLIIDEIPACHTWDEGTVTTEPTCEVPGVKTFACTVDGCEGTKTEAIDPEGHTWDEGAVTTEPTCASGVKTYKCTIEGCEGEKTEEIAPIVDHDFEPTEETKITETGVYVVESCQNCQTTQNGDLVEGYNVISDDNIVIESNTTTIFYGDKNYGVITLSGELENVTITSVNGAKISMIAIAGKVNNLTVKNVEFDTVSSVYYIETQEGSTLKNAVIDSCTFNGKNLLNNAINIRYGDIENLTVKDCKFQDLDWSSMPVFICEQEDVGTVEITGNTVDNFQQRFILINSVTSGEIIIEENVLSNWMYVEGTDTNSAEIIKASSTTATIEVQNNTLDGVALGALETDDKGNLVVYADKTNESETPDYVDPEEPEPPENSETPEDEGVENI